MRVLSMVAVVAASAVAGVVTTLGLGIGCAHCSPLGGLVILAVGVLATVGVAVGGTRLRRRLLDSAAARRRTVALAAGATAGVITAVVLWNVLFHHPYESKPPYPSLEEALPEAVDAGGAHRWPGTTVRVGTVDRGEAVVERRWLGLEESTVTVVEAEGRWRVYGPTTSYGWFVQVVLACAIPALLATGAAWRAAHRRLLPAGRQ